MKPSDSPIHPHDDVIEAMAASWLAQREEGFTPEQETEFLRWRLADPRHGEAVDRLEETCALLEQLPELRGDSRLEPAAGIPAPAAPTNQSQNAPQPRRARIGRWVALGGLAAALVAAAVLWRADESAPLQATYATAPADYRRVQLPDSSVAQLNGGPHLQVDYTGRERLVKLEAGEAHFHVAKDEARPFVVRTQGLRVIAVGTAFNVRVAAAGVDVLVTEGVVRVERESAPAAAPIVLAAGERTVVSESVALPVQQVDNTEIKETLAWQEPRLVFVEAPLAEVVARFNERNRVQLELGDPALGQSLVGGTFRRDDVETFVRLLEQSGDFITERPAPDRIVLRRAR